MAPRRHGDMAITESTAFSEWYWRTELGAVLGNGSGWSHFNIGAFQIPWRGQAIADMTLDFGWAGPNTYQQVASYFGYGSPAPNSATQTNRLASNNFGDFYGTLPVLGIWNELAANQVVNITLSCYVGGGGPNVTISRIAGSVRMLPNA